MIQVWQQKEHGICIAAHIIKTPLRSDSNGLDLNGVSFLSRQAQDLTYKRF